jgi:hypothetical protein
MRKRFHKHVLIIRDCKHTGGVRSIYVPVSSVIGRTGEFVASGRGRVPDKTVRNPSLKVVRTALVRMAR